MPVLDFNVIPRNLKGSFASREAALAAGLHGDLYRPSTSTSITASLAHRDDRICGAPECSGRWVKPWKNRRRPIFEEEWGCSQRCLHSLISASVRRASGDAGALEEQLPHRHRVPLGLVLLAQGWITNPQLQSALQAQKASGRGRIGDWLTQSCGLPEERVTRGLGVQWNCPVLSLDGFSPSKMALTMPRRLIAEYSVLPLRIAGTSLLYLASDCSRSPTVALGLEKMTGLRVEAGLLSTPQYELARQRLLAADAIPVTMNSLNDSDDLVSSVQKTLQQKQPLGSRLVRIGRYYWLRLWLESATLGGPGRLPATTSDMEDHLYVIGQ